MESAGTELDAKKQNITEMRSWVSEEVVDRRVDFEKSKAMTSSTEGREDGWMLKEFVHVVVEVQSSGAYLFKRESWGKRLYYLPMFK